VELYGILRDNTLNSVPMARTPKRGSIGHVDHGKITLAAADFYK